VVLADHTWVAFIDGLPVNDTCSALLHIPSVLTHDSFVELFTMLNCGHTCIGNGESKFVSMCEDKKGKFLSLKKEVVAFVHETGSSKVVRHVSCELLVRQKNERCSLCKSYRVRLRAMHSSYSRQKLSNNKTNHRYLTTPQRTTRILDLKKKVKNVMNRNRRLTKLLEDMTSSSGITTDSVLQEDVTRVLTANMNEINQLPQNDFRTIFWKQQV
jgi:hypothetical protein